MSYHYLLTLNIILNNNKQIMYLDSIDIGVMNIEHSSFPRIKHFAAEELKSMILADSLSRKPDNLDFEYGRSQVSTTRKDVSIPLHK